MPMRIQQIRQLRIGLIALITLAELLVLAWEYTHGGAKSHHLLNRPDLPAISNWWGALLLPILAWFLSGSILRRAGVDKARKIPVGIVAGFGGALFYGLLLALAFIQHYEAISTYLFLGMFLAAALLPVYRAEYLLGFVLSMTFTFGAGLPTIVGSLVAAVSAILHFLVRQVIRLIRRQS